MSGLHQGLRDYVDVCLSRRILRDFTFKTAIDVGAGGSKLPGLVGAIPVDVPEFDAHNLHQIGNGEFDLCLCVNVLEHLHSPFLALKELRRIAKAMYLCWTPWASPFGGHEFSPFHFFGATSGHIHKLGVNLFKTDVDSVLGLIAEAGWKTYVVRPRYWPRLSGLTLLPGKLKDFLSWNIEVIAH